jgi:hypothetical protein
MKRVHLACKECGIPAETLWRRVHSYLPGGWPAGVRERVANLVFVCGLCMGART